GEHEDEQDGLQHRPQSEGDERLAQDGEVAQQQRDERVDRGAPRRTNFQQTQRRHSRRSLPVSLMNTVSSVGSATEMSDTWNPFFSACAMIFGTTPSVRRID